MNNDSTELEAELQVMREAPQPGEKPIEQIYWLMARPAVGNKWDVKVARVKGDSQMEEYSWVEKSVNFFRACVSDLKMGNMPDIDGLLEKEMKGKERMGDQVGGGSSKSPKIKPQALMGMKGGRGF
jgi:hypothetical protein